MNFNLLTTPWPKSLCKYQQKCELTCSTFDRTWSTPSALMRGMSKAFSAVQARAQQEDSVWILRAASCTARTQQEDSVWILRAASCTGPNTARRECVNTESCELYRPGHSTKRVCEYWELRAVQARTQQEESVWISAARIVRIVRIFVKFCYEYYYSNTKSIRRICSGNLKQAMSA